MKALYLLIFTTLLSNFALANTVQISGDNFSPGAGSTRTTSAEDIYTSRDRYTLGANWSSGVASFSMVIDYSIYPNQNLFQNPVRIGLAGSSNPDFMTQVRYGPGYLDTYFLTSDLNDLISPDFVRISSAAMLPPSAVLDATAKTLTINWSPVLQNGQNYYLFVEFSGPIGGMYQYNAVLSQVPLPAGAWLLGSGLLGLAGIARRKAGTAAVEI